MFILEPDPPFWTKTSCLQFGYGIWVNLTLIGMGMALGFSAVTIPQLLQPDSTIKLTTQEEGLIASVLTLSAPLGSLICGIMMDKYGRKILLVVCEIPMFIGWLYAAFANIARDIIIGRIVCGVGIGMMMSAPRAYITEITLPNMRGVVGALPNLITSIGLSIQAGLGTFLKWYQLCYIGAAFALILGVSKMFLPDTPYFKILTTTASNTRTTLQKFRSSHYNINAEIDELNDFKTVNNIRRLSAGEYIVALFQPSSCKPFGIVVGYILLTQLCGVNVVIMWAVEMLQTAKSSVDPRLGNVILGLTRIVFGVVASIALFKVGRRPLALLSAIGLGIVCILLGGYLYSNSAFNETSIYPLLFFIGYIAFATLGFYTLPFMMMFELLPLQVRGVLSGIAITMMNLLMFSLNLSYPIMRENLGLDYTFIIFGIFSLLGALFLYFVLPETKGLTLQEIEEYFNSRRPTLVSQRTVMNMQLAASSSRREKAEKYKEDYNKKDQRTQESNIDNMLKHSKAMMKERFE